MNVIVQAQTLDLTQALHAFARQQLAKLSKFSDKITAVRMTIDQLVKSQQSGQLMEVKIHIQLAGLPDIIIKERGADMYHLITKAVSRAIRHVRKAKERVLAKHR